MNNTISQYVYKVSLADAVDAVHEAAAVFSGLQYGGATPESTIEKLTSAADKDDVLHVSKACQILSDLETPKMLGGANQGLQAVIQAINKKRFRGA